MKRLLSATAFSSMLFLGVLGMAAPASADLLTFTLDESGCCGTGPFATVTIEDMGANVVAVEVDLINPPSSGITNTGLTSFVFNNSVALTSSDVSDLTAGFAWATTIKGDGAGTFDYGFDCTVAGCGDGGSSPNPGPLAFTLTAAGLSTATFTANAVNGDKGGNYFGVDICYLADENGCTATGMTWTSVLPPPCTTGPECNPPPCTRDCGDTNVPEPTPLALLAASAIALCVSRRRLRLRR